MCRKILSRHILQFLKFCETALGGTVFFVGFPIKIKSAEEVEKKHDEADGFFQIDAHFHVHSDHAKSTPPPKTVLHQQRGNEEQSDADKNGSAEPKKISL